DRRHEEVRVPLRQASTAGQGGDLDAVARNETVGRRRGDDVSRRDGRVARVDEGRTVDGRERDRSGRLDEPHASVPADFAREERLRTSVPLSVNPSAD